MSQVFYNTTALKKVILPPRLTTLGYFTFSKIGTNVELICPSTLINMDASVIRTSNSGSLIYMLHSDVKNFAGLKQTSKIVRIYVPDEYLENYQTYLDGNANLSKLYPLSEYEGES